MNNSLDWMAGTVETYLSVGPDASLVIDDGGPKAINGGYITNEGTGIWPTDDGVTVSTGTFRNLGDFTFEGPGNFAVSNGPNAAGVTFQNNGTTSFLSDGASEFQGTFNNANILNIGGGTFTIAGTAFQNTDNVQVNTGTLEINAPGTSTGAFSVGLGALLVFYPLGNDIVLGPQSSVSGSGTVLFDSPVADKTIVSGTYNVAATIVDGTVSFTSNVSSTTTFVSGFGDLQISAVFTDSGAFFWEGGTLEGIGWLTIAQASSLSVNAAVTLKPALDIINQGTITLAPGALIKVPATLGSIRLQNQGTLNILADQVFSISGTTLSITNSGTITKMVDPITGLGQGTTILPNLVLTNSGSIGVQNGTLILQGSGTFQNNNNNNNNNNPVSLSVSTGAVLGLSGSFRVLSATQVQGGGSLQVLGGTFDVSAASVTVSNMALLKGLVTNGTVPNGTVADPPRIPGLPISTITNLTVQQRFVWQGGELLANMTIPATGTMFVSTTSTTPLVLGGVINNQGTASWSGPVRIQLLGVNLQNSSGNGPTIFRDPRNAILDNESIVTAWNALLTSLATRGATPGQVGASGAFLQREYDANALYNTTVTSGDQSLANQYVSAYKKAQSDYKAALAAATTFDQVADADDNFSNAVAAAANTFVNAEAGVYQSYLTNSNAGEFQAGVNSALATFNQAISGAMAPQGNVPLTVAQVQNLLTIPGSAEELRQAFVNVPAESRASFLLLYWRDTGAWLPYSNQLITGSNFGLSLTGPTGNSATILGLVGTLTNPGTWAANIGAALSALNPVSVLSRVPTVINNVGSFVSQIVQTLQQNPGALLAGAANTGIVILNTFTFGAVDSLNQQAQQIVQQSGFYRTIQVASVFARELGLTYLTMGAAQLAGQVGARVVGSIATGLGVSSATQASILCTVNTVQRLMAPLRAYEQMVGLTSDLGQVRQAIQSGDYEGAAAILDRTTATLPSTVTALRDTARLAGAVASFDAQTINNYLQACFAAGTPILWERGSKPVEDFEVGERVWARNEADPEGPVELREIEELFVRAAPIWHLHVGGQLIRTTAEHPFWVQSRGWTPASELHIGDVLVSHDGQTSLVEDVFETGDWETVYNFRVAEHHTYFVGTQEWGFSVWAHNAACTVVVNHRAGNRQVRTTTGQRWNLPVGKSGNAIPDADAVGDQLQQLTTQAAGRWTQADLTVSELAAINQATADKEYWLANLLTRQAMGRWVETQVETATREQANLIWSSTGVDVIDKNTGIAYEILSGTKSNVDLHARRMSGLVFRMITFQSRSR